MQKNKYIEIVTSPIGGLNLMPQKILLNLHEKLSKHYKKVKITIIKNRKDLDKLIEKKPDLVVSGLKYLLFDEDSKKRDSEKKLWFTDILEKHDILYTGSSKNALKLEFDKSIAKEKIRGAGLKTASSFVAKPNQYDKESLPLPFPLFVKPLYEGDSRGIDEHSLVHKFKEYENKVKSIFKEQHTVSLVETYLSGKEYTVAIIEDFKNSTYDIYPIELIAEKNSKGDRVLGFFDKQRDREKSLKIKDKEIKELISSLAINAFKVLKAKGYGRIDIKMNGEGIPYFIEANLVPGLGYGYFYRCYHLNTGLEHEQMVLDIVKSTFSKKTIKK